MGVPIRRRNRQSWPWTRRRCRHYYFYKSLTIITYYDYIPESTIFALMTVLLLPLLLSESIMTLLALMAMLCSLFVFELL